ncbi:hypothetical protein [Ruegeria sp. HKCCD6109]|uniref:hypothetical protein n=1 Tax=Ruegeria sp. HKCCD6109 TaxID=2683017 RepID=UPI001490C553|nr:hypothetical protein [Ruegeria sp. HKCCD6109]NOD65749.1 hypothetical protein [Ruegeria sp. HKCCD6109]
MFRLLMDVVSGIFVAGAIAWLFVPSTLFVNPISMTLKGDQVRFVRETPYGTVQARWRSEITLIGDGFECNSGRWQEATYQEIKGNTVTYRIGDWANDCLEAGPPFFLRTTRKVILFGWLPLRPDVSTTEVSE